jgi:hypothetical protein
MLYTLMKNHCWSLEEAVALVRMVDFSFQRIHPNVYHTCIYIHTYISEGCKLVESTELHSNDYRSDAISIVGVQDCGIQVGVQECGVQFQSLVRSISTGRPCCFLAAQYSVAIGKRPRGEHCREDENMVAA